jgi:hypothetical protein
MNRILAAAAAFALTLPATQAATAATVTIQDIVAAFSNPTLDGPGAPATIGGSGTANPTLRWGETSGRRSGYNFSATPGAIDVVLPPTPSADFALGTFTHLNYVIGQPFLTGAVLTVSAEILINGSSRGTRDFVFDIVHTETPNNLRPCPFGGANGQGINAGGCADRVAFSSSASSETFEVDGQALTLNIQGFQVGGDLTTDFLTREGRANVATLIANVTLAPDPIDPVPTPMSLALFATGLFGIAAVARRRRA